MLTKTKHIFFSRHKDKYHKPLDLSPILLGLAHALFSLFPTYEVMLGSSSIYGFFFGLILSQCSPVILEAVGPDRFDFAQAVDNTVYGLFTAAGGSVAGNNTSTIM